MAQWLEHYTENLQIMGVNRVHGCLWDLFPIGVSPWPYVPHKIRADCK